MKMPENMTCWPPFRKGTRHRGNPAFAMAYLRGRYNGGARLQNSNRRNDVRHYRLVHS